MLSLVTSLSVNDWKVHLNVYSEQDSKNQPLQQDLIQSEKDLLAQVGDDLLAAIAPSADSVGFFCRPGSLQKSRFIRLYARLCKL